MGRQTSTAQILGGAVIHSVSVQQGNARVRESGSENQKEQQQRGRRGPRVGQLSCPLTKANALIQPTNLNPAPRRPALAPRRGHSEAGFGRNVAPISQ